jgi:hypothetical protein
MYIMPITAINVRIQMIIVIALLVLLIDDVFFIGAAFPPCMTGDTGDEYLPDMIWSPDIAYSPDVFVSGSSTKSPPYSLK